MIKDDLGISESSLKFLVDEVANKSLEIYSYFEIVPGDMKPFSQLLQEANEELSNLNLTYETLLVELKQEKMLAERLAQELVDANNSLREMSFRDYLTGLYNRRYLYDFLEKEISRSERFGRCFSVLVFDIDYFKKLNDTYGHHVGDLVLKTLSEKAEGIKRETDIVARYGGEEFVMVLPETELERALIVAERLRMVIEDMDIAVVSDKINVTVSVGVAAYSPQSKEITIDSLINSADKALYDAKNSGRNKVVSSIPNVW
jgi:diguanylate cyclase (GGDEF)-like protein